MIDCMELSKVVEMQESASDEAIAHTQAMIGCLFPSPYVELLKCSDGFSVPDVVNLHVYSTSGLPERNTTYEVATYLPGWLLIGSDGGGRGIFLNCTDQEGAIYIVGLGSMLRSDMVLLASNAAEWVTRGFSLDPLS